MPQTQNIHIRETIPLPSPQLLREQLPATEQDTLLVAEWREQILKILSGDDKRLIITVGPCSIHDKNAAIDYAERLSQLSAKVSDQFLLVMRVYFEKPRTTLGWKGLINDPHLDDTFDMSTGLRLAREILLKVTRLQIPSVTELLEPITPQYIADLIALAAIGARTTESPTHRQMASGLSMPVGYKNGTDGNLDVAINAMQAACSPHRFLGIDSEGQTCIVHTTGNPSGFLILRGGRSGPNYSPEHVRMAAEQLNKAGLSPRFMVDCSHANSNKDYRRQAEVWNEVIEQRISGNDTIIGLMIESNLSPGTQKLTTNLAELQYGVSITDGCIGWEETEQLILSAHEKLATSSLVAR